MACSISSKMVSVQGSTTSSGPVPSSAHAIGRILVKQFVHFAINEFAALAKVVVIGVAQGKHRVPAVPNQVRSFVLHRALRAIWFRPGHLWTMEKCHRRLTTTTTTSTGGTGGKSDILCPKTVETTMGPRRRVQCTARRFCRPTPNSGPRGCSPGRNKR
jgi:hypothetical protein